MKLTYSDAPYGRTSFRPGSNEVVISLHQLRHHPDCVAIALGHELAHVKLGHGSAYLSGKLNFALAEDEAWALCLGAGDYSSVELKAMDKFLAPFGMQAGVPLARKMIGVRLQKRGAR